ncbi:hypothetical protein ANCCEY_10762 [Ancylostoma ceylanicum]|uniref:Major facilitator superfamily (MFS) profile domain-containing protein n=1 Tax=Ancylostoma ceylanicum TaxID=53326 RepID=A0A0D6LG31_9BILA|nr:hypothetical protein ANCCEY_10762 [Ancylostoma ceylanicum]
MSILICINLLNYMDRFTIAGEHPEPAVQISFLMFLLFRGIVGIGEASYVTISPTMIADMFTGRNRSRMLMLFYFAIPFGSIEYFSGLGFIVGSRVAALTGRWEWGVRVSVIFGELNHLQSG